MEPEPSPSAGSGVKKKRQLRRAFSLAEKLNILNKMATGIGATKIAREYNVNESTIRNMRKQEAAIRAIAGTMTSEVAAGALRTRHPQYAKMEACLTTWLDDARAKRLPLSVAKIRSKSLQLYELIGKQMAYDEHGGYSASKGWFARFQKKYEVYELRAYDDRIPASESEFKEMFKSTVQGGGYTLDQIFMADNTSFWWKRMPGLEDVEKATMMFCSNASGELVLQPILYSARAGQVASELLFLRFDRPGSITEHDISDWFYDHFVPEVERYLGMKQLPAQFILVLPHDRKYPSVLEHDSVEILTIPPDCNSSCLPATQGILAHLNAVYLEQVCQKLLRDFTPGTPLQDAWDQFSITDGLQLLGLSVSCLDKPVLRNGWSNLFDQIPGSYSNEKIVQKIVKIVRSLGLKKVTDQDVRDLVTPRELTNDEVIAIFQKHQAEAESASFVIPGYNQQQMDAEGSATEGDEMDHGLRIKVADEIDQHLAALLRAQTFFTQQDKNRIRAEAVGKRLNQVSKWVREMRSEIYPEDPIGVVTDDPSGSFRESNVTAEKSIERVEIKSEPHQYESE